MSNEMNEIPEGVRLFARPESKKDLDRIRQMYRDGYKVLNNQPKSVHHRLKLAQHVIQEFMDFGSRLTDNADMLIKQLAEIQGSQSDRAGKRWTDEEDAWLIERATNGDSLLEMALTFARTPGAISARISHLVGIKRISEEFAGQIKGYLNGEEVEGTFTGELRR